MGGVAGEAVWTVDGDAIGAVFLVKSVVKVLVLEEARIALVALLEGGAGGTVGLGFETAKD